MRINEIEERRLVISSEIDTLLEGELNDEVRAKITDLENEDKTLASDLKIKQRQAERAKTITYPVTESHKEDNTFYRSFETYLKTGVAPDAYRGSKPNSFIIPQSILRGLTNTTAIGDAKGKTVESGVSIAKSPALELLQGAGVKFLFRPFGSGDYVIPSSPMPTASTVAEGVAGADASISLTNNTLTPSGHRITVYSYFTLEEQASLDVEAQNDLIQALADSVYAEATYKFFDNLESDAASAIFTIEASTLSYGDFVKAQERVPYQLSNPRYIVAPAVASKAKKMATIASVAGPIWTGSILTGDVDGIPANGSPFANTDMIYYGDFSKARMVQWGGMEVQFNPFEKDAEGEIKVVARAIIDSGPENYRYFAICDASLS